MLGPKRSLKIFLCHAHTDRERVYSLYSRLTKDGVDAWLDQEKLLPGQDWELEIRKAVREADAVLVCISKQFNQAGFRQKEVRLALDEADKKPDGEIFIIPTRLEECENLESLRRWHWVDLFASDGYENLKRTLITRAKEIDANLPLSANKFTHKYSEALSVLNLRQLLVLLIDIYNRNYRASIRINCPNDIYLGLWTKHTLWEIVSEALSNAVLHTGFYKNRSIKIAVDVVVSNNGRDLELCVSDTGPGFDFAKVYKSGLTRMKSSIESPNLDCVSKLSIMSEPDKGTKVILKMSFPQSIVRKWRLGQEQE